MPHSTVEATADTWVVITSISEPTELMLQINKWLLKVGTDGNTCLLVVGNKKGPFNFMMLGDGACVHFLSVADQETLPFVSVGKTPWNHFGRKKLGYLYAILHGATAIWDTDDDRSFLEPEQTLNRLTRRRATVQLSAASCETPPWNIYQNFSASNPAIWPRGLPLNEINRRSGCTPVNEPHSASDHHRVWVWQALANHDPDVDATYRLTQPLPVTFSANTHAVALSPGTVVPFNAQATLWKRRALWCMYLPVGVHGRMSDICRSYVCQTLFWWNDGMVGFHSPTVVQERNAHNYMKDFESEKQLYSQANVLVAYLAKWKPAAATKAPSTPYFTELMELEELMIDLYTRGFVEMACVSEMQAWITDLVALGHNMSVH